ncbi:MAG TPA: asparagine synthase (glutamine-hydrolyzing) [Gemmatimonadota bacterium]|nr:asparagine synthase (glutamine-hydrolyzing) [Gemmatimonadota bacterium]
MCGIGGIAYTDPGRWARREDLERMSAALRHRGPDGDGRWEGPGAGLAVRRLAIIDPETGDQPLSNEDGTVVLVCNGEIYNHVELRRELLARGHRFRSGSDAEVIVHLYEELGPSVVERLRGMFAFGLWDASRRRLLLARDRLGIKSLVFVVSPGALTFASETKALLAADMVDPSIDPRAVGQLLTLGFVQGPRTFFEGVRRLSPGHWMTFEAGRIEDRRYWDVPLTPLAERPQQSAAEWSEGLKDKLDDTVRLHLRSDVPVAAWLSGGIDSSAVAALACLRRDDPLKAISLAFEDPDSDEVGKVRTLADFPGFDIDVTTVECGSPDLAWFPTAVWHAEEPTGKGLEIPRLLLSRATGALAKVVLTGEGADEVLTGYGWYRIEKALRPLALVPPALRRALAPLFSRARPWTAGALAAPEGTGLSRFAAMMRPGDADKTQRLLTPAFARHALEGGTPLDPVELPDALERFHPLEQLQYLELKTRLPDYINLILDRQTMAWSVEARVPFLDHELVEYCMQIPPSLKLRRLTEKYVLRRAMRGVVPDEILERPKRPLVAPHRRWMREELPEFARALLEGESLRAKGYFEPREVDRVRRAAANGAHGASEAALAVLAVQVWDEIYVRGWRPKLAPAAAA